MLIKRNLVLIVPIFTLRPPVRREGDESELCCYYGGGGGGGGGWRLSLHFTLRDNRNNDHPALEIFHYMDLDYIPMKSLTSG